MDIKVIDGEIVILTFAIPRGSDGAQGCDLGVRGRESVDMRTKLICLGCAGWPTFAP